MSGAAQKAAIALFAVLIAAVPLSLSNYYVSLLSYVGIYSLCALGLVLLTGAVGLISFGQAAFVGVGAYTTAVLTTSFGVSPWIGLPAAFVACAVVALALGLLSLRLSGHYLALLTIAWGMMIYLMFGNIAALGGHSGINDIPALNVFGISLASGQRYYVLIWIVVALAILGASNLLNSRKGRAMRTLKGGDALAESLGINAFQLRLKVFVLAALLSGLAGWLYAHMQRYVGPTPFDLSEGIMFLLMAVIGGAGSVWGAIIGAFVITTLSSLLQFVLPFVTSRAANLEIIVYGCLFVLLLQVARGGLVGMVRRWMPPRLKPAEAAVVKAEADELVRKDMPERGSLLLSVTNLTKRFGGLVAVNDVSFELRAGIILGLIGPNGAGKSTTFNIISGIQEPTSGRIVFADIDLSATNTRRFVKAGMARTFQHVKLRSNMSALENVMLGAYSRTGSGVLKGMFRLDRAEEAAVRAEAQRQLARVGLAERQHELAGNLPLGQQRTLEVARALAADPVLLMLDEPAAGLRRPEKQDLSRLLRSLRDSGVSILLVEHDMDFVMGLVDRIVVLDFGKKLIEGTPSEIRSSPVVQEAYLGGVS